jgi:hypothetical protein
MRLRLVGGDDDAVKRGELSGYKCDTPPDCFRIARRSKFEQKHFILHCQTILAHAVGVDSKRRRHVAVAKYLLHCLHVGPLPHEEACQAMTEVVEPEADLLTFLEHARFHRSRTEMIFDQHVRDAGLLSLKSCAGKHPVRRPTVRCLLLPLANEACE